MTEREQKTMSLLFRLVDAVETLPLTERLDAYEKVSTEVGKAKAHLKIYKDEVRGDIQQAVVDSEINHRFTNITIHQ